jgi:DNA-binding LytR/AlgR family response regulator
MLWVYQEPKNTCSLLGKKNERLPKQFKLSLQNVRYCTSAGVKKNYIKFVTVENEEYFKLITLQKVMSMHSTFLGVSKDAVVNTSHIDKRYDWLFVWTGKHCLPVSKSRRSQVRRVFENIV